MIKRMSMYPMTLKNRIMERKKRKEVESKFKTVFYKVFTFYTTTTNSYILTLN